MRIFGRHKGEKGVATILVVGVLVVFLIFFLVLAIDFAYMYVVRGQVQNAADAAALAGAAVMTCNNDTVQSAARQEAIRFASENFAVTTPMAIVTDNTNILSDGNDITVGVWNGTAYTPGATPVNAVRVRPRRTEASPGGPVGLFFGKLIGWPSMEVSRLATAQGCLRNLSPISVNEYWMGDSPLGSCSPARYDVGRDPYGRNHIYPNSFVRPPCTTAGATNCLNPTNGNMTLLTNVGNCSGINNSSSFTPNGPLSVNCNTLGSGACDGRPPGKPMAGRVFAVVGGNARGNAPGYNIFGLIDLDRRVGISTTGGQWYKVMGNTYTPVPFASSNPDKDVAAGYIFNGKYPHELPTSITEVFQPGYTAVTPYYSSQPYASTSFFTGQGVVGNDVRANFYDSGRYSGGKYAPGKKIIVAVYDGIVGDNGNQNRTTIVGFTTITIFGYGNSLKLNVAGQPVVTGTQNTMYGYIENVAESVKPSVSDLPPLTGKSVLVQ